LALALALSRVQLLAAIPVLALLLAALWVPPQAGSQQSARFILAGRSGDNDPDQSVLIWVLAVSIR
jgi:hypothetical protein